MFNKQELSFDEGWKIVDAAGENRGTILSDDGRTAKMSDLRKYAITKRIIRSIDLKDKKTYKVTVSFSASHLCSVLHVYAILSFYNEKSEWTRRCYFDRPSEGLFEKSFTVNGEVRAELELGLKTTGEVIWQVPVVEEREPIEKRVVKIAAVQINPGNGKITYEQNLRRIEKGFDKAADMGADVVCFAETINDRGVGGYSCYAEKFEPLDGSFVTFMKRKTSERKIFAFFTFHELDKDGVKRNTAILMDRNGVIAGRYFKSHITIGEYEDGMLPGDEYPVFDTEIGRIGMLVCWDAYFPETARAMALKGAELLLISTAGNPTHFHIARAMENGVYVAVACAASQPDNCIYPTKIISPSGKIIAEAKSDGDIAFAEVDLNKEENTYIYWLSVGPAYTDPHNIYQNEFRPEMYPRVTARSYRRCCQKKQRGI